MTAIWLMKKRRHMEIWSESRRGSSDRGCRSLWVALTLCVLRDDWLGTCSASLTVRVSGDAWPVATVAVTRSVNEVAAE
jgi:hypothetical protein